MSQPSQRPHTDIPLLTASQPHSFARLVRRDRLRFLQELTRGGDIFRLQLPGRTVVATTGPELLHELLVDNAAALEKGSMLRYVTYPLIGEGLFNSGGQLWRQQRRVMAPIFPPAQISHFADSIVACAERDVSTWQDGAILDLSRETTRIAMSVAGKTLFDAETFSEADELGAALTVALAWSGHNIASLMPVLQDELRRSLAWLASRLPGRARTAVRNLSAHLHGPVFLFTKEDRRLKAAITLLHQRVQRMIDDRRAAGQDRLDLLGRLLSARDQEGARMSDQQVRDEVLTLFVAGHETTASALAWTIYLLARHPEIYTRARAEADALGRPPRYEDLPRLGLLLGCFKESLRLYPPVSLFIRDTTAPITVGGYHLPAGTALLLSPYATHHRADLWPEPERYDPERFRPQQEAARHRLAFIPFSAGPRVCIGNHFALMEGPLVLATLLQRADFELTSTTAIVPHMEATLRPQGGVPMRIRLRGLQSRARPALPRPSHALAREGVRSVKE